MTGRLMEDPELGNMVYALLFYGSGSVAAVRLRGLDAGRGENPGLEKAAPLPASERPKHKPISLKKDFTIRRICD